MSDSAGIWTESAMREHVKRRSNGKCECNLSHPKHTPSKCPNSKDLDFRPITPVISYDPEFWKLICSECRSIIESGN